MGKSKIQYVVVPDPEVDLISEMAKEMEAAQADDGVEVDGPTIASKVRDRHSIKIALVTASRLKAYDRAEFLDAVQSWFLKAMGIDDAVQLAEIEDFPPGVRSKWFVLKQAADIVGSLVPEECVGWEPPEEMEGWFDVPDYIFEPVFEKAIGLNPHWGLEYSSLGNA